MLRAVLLLAAILLVSCGDSLRHGPPLLTECEPDREYTITVRILPTEDDVEKAYREYMRERGLRYSTEVSRAGWTVLRPEGERLMVLPAIRGRKDTSSMAVWGHELVHAFCGDWHPPDEVL